ncbi:MAG: U32 family peptidase [Chloroflexi bacterium]|nr:U32 family peptidase [Chloroflexota bacterium]
MKPENKASNFSRPELLSPAGSRDSLLAAVNNGADAVYLGVKELNARIYARNFTLDELRGAIDYCHNRGVRVYLTLNILVKNSEVRRFFDVLSQAYALGIDGVIIQHISFLDVIKDNFPDLNVFISTQAAIGNVASASLLKRADRIILPRELTLGEIKRIINSGAKVEIFVHGALCFSYSGLCLFSSFVGNRSGNRGSCAQLCRQKYNGRYPLSTRELCLVRRVPELITAGISGFKIEGRMRSPLYVAVATRLYRKAIDSFLEGDFNVPQKELSEIEVVFNREFTEGFIFGEKDIVSPEKPMNRGAFLGVLENSRITVQRPVGVGDGVGIWSQNVVTGAVIKEMSSNGRKIESVVTGERVNLNLVAKNGSRVYLTSSTKISLEPDLTVKRAPIASQRRGEVNLVLPQVSSGHSLSTKLLAKVYSLSEARETSQTGADIVFYNIFYPDFPDKEDWQEKAQIGAYLPRILTNGELESAVSLLLSKRPGAILTGNLGFLAHRVQFDLPVYLDYSLNAFNDLDLLFFRKYDVIPMLSPELSMNELAAFKNKDAVILCHGDIALANTKIELEDRKLADEKGLVFPVRKEGGYWQILNSRPFGLFNDIRKLHDAGFNQFFIDRENQSAKFVAFYRRMLKEDVVDRRMRKGYTSGHLYRPVG